LILPSLNIQCLIFIIAWAKDKIIPWVLSGISRAFTKMNNIIWNQTPNNTNVGESAHANMGATFPFLN